VIGIDQLIMIGFTAVIGWSNLDTGSLKKLIGKLIPVLRENTETTQKLLNKLEAN